MRRERRELIWLQLAVGYLVALKLAYAAIVPPNDDEAYYWLWGQHLQLSYLDHAPLVGWSSAVASLLGWTPFALHLPALVSFAVLVLVLRQWVTRTWPTGGPLPFWTALAVLCASPILFVLTTLNYPDHLLLCFSALALVRFAAYLGEEGDERTGRPTDLYLGALFLGLAGLSKYSAALIGLALVLAICLTPRWRHLLGTRHLYLAAGASLLLQLPVLWWNIENRFLSLTLHTTTRFDSANSAFVPTGGAGLLLLSALELSPFLVWGLLVLVFGRTRAGRIGALQAIGRWTAALAIVAGIGLASWAAAAAQVSPHWMVLGFLPLVLVVPEFVRSRWLVWLHIGWGAVLLSVVSAYYLASPLLAMAAGYTDREAAQTFGQDQLAQAARRAGEARGVELFAAPSYGPASKLAFGLGSGARVYSLKRRMEQFRLWQDYGAVAGRSMIIVDTGGATADRYADWFDAVESLGPLTTERFGQPLATFQLFLGTGFRPPADPAER